MTAENIISSLPKEIIRASEENRLILFFGAGVSCTAGLPTWEGLRKELIAKAKEADIPHIDELEKTQDLYACFQMLEAYLPDNFQTFVRKSLESSNAKNINNYKKVIKTLSESLNPVAILNLNIDNLLQENNTFKDLKNYAYKDECSAYQLRENYICSLHGNIHKNSWVITQEQLSDLYGNDKTKALVLNLLGSYTVLFLGFSFNDAELLRLNNYVKKPSYRDCDPFHYAILPGNEKSFTTTNLRDLHGIEVLFYNNDSNDHTNFLKSILSWKKDSNPVEITESPDEFPAEVE